MREKKKLVMIPNRIWKIVEEKKRRPKKSKAVQFITKQNKNISFLHIGLYT